MTYINNFFRNSYNSGEMFSYNSCSELTARNTYIGISCLCFLSRCFLCVTRLPSCDALAAAVWLQSRHSVAALSWLSSLNADRDQGREEGAGLGRMHTAKTRRGRKMRHSGWKWVQSTATLPSRLGACVSQCVSPSLARTPVMC